MEKYKKGDYIAVMTNQPDIHFLEMFGHGLSTDNVEPSEYVAKIKNVIDDDNYLIFIVHPTTYRCVVSGSEIIRKMSDDELTAEIREEEYIIEFMAPNVYENCAVLNGTISESSICADKVGTICLLSFSFSISPTKLAAVYVS